MATVPSWRERYIGLILAAGIVSLCVGLGIYLVTGLFDRVTAILLALGIVLVAWYLVEEYQTVIQALKGRQARYGGNTAALVLIFIAIIGVINFVSVRHSLRADLTASREFSLSAQTVKVLNSLKQPVTAKAFFRQDDYGRMQAEDLLKEYQRHSDKLQFEFVDWETHPGDALAYKLQNFPVIVFESAGHRQDVTGFVEQDLTSGIFKVSSGEPKKLLFTSGHGEPDIAAMTETGFGAAKQALEASNYKVDTINLAATPAIGDDVAGLVIDAPKTALLDAEKKTIKDYLDRGGKAMILVAPKRTTDLSDIVAPYGLKIGDGYVIDAQALTGQPYVPVITNYPQYSPITRDIQASNQAVLLPMATMIGLPDKMPEGIEATQLLASTSRSWLAPDEKDMNYHEGDAKGPLSVGVALTAPATAGAQANVPGGDQSAKKARLIVFGSADFASNIALSALANEQLFVNSVNWLTEEEDLISIRPQPPVDRTLQLTGTQAKLMIFSSVVFLPILMAAAGGYVWWRRR